MNILDENILKDQRELLLSRRVKIRQIGYDVGRKVYCIPTFGH